MLSTLGKIFSRRYFEIFFLIFPKETICMKCQILFSGKNKKNIINLSSAENAQRVVKVNPLSLVLQLMIDYNRSSVTFASCV